MSVGDSQLGALLLVLTQFLEEFLDLLKFDDHDLDLVFVELGKTSLSCLLLEQTQLVIMFVLIPVSKSLQELGIVLRVFVGTAKQFLLESFFELSLE